MAPRYLLPVLLAVLIGFVGVVHADCPDGCLCLDKKTATGYGLDELCSEDVCGVTPFGTKMYCFKPYECPKSCYCVSEETAREKNLVPCGDEKKLCGIEGKTPLYCFAEPRCPEGCECLTKDEAVREGYNKLCSDTVCGYAQSSTGEVTKKYCWKREPVECPEGCECLLPADAESRGYTLCGDQKIYCGEFLYGGAMYCYKPPQYYQCPESCECLTEEGAKEKFLCPEKCSGEICGYEGVTTSSNPKYCFRETCNATVLCPPECECMTEDVAKEKGYTERCGTEECGVVGDEKKEYCFKKVYMCPEGCECLSDDEVKKYAEAGVKLERCGSEKCEDGNYCWKKVAECPEGCECLNDEEVKEYYAKGVKLERCSEEPCEDGYCYRKAEVECPQGCQCLNKEEGYKLGLDFCTDSNGMLLRCGTAGEEYLYCFRKPEERCHFEANRCVGYCEDGRCTFGADYMLCMEECKLKFEECLKENIEEECKKVFEECSAECKPYCECQPYPCPPGCLCLSDEEVKKYESSGATVERCSERTCKAGNYCYSIKTGECEYDYSKGECVGSCKEGECQLNTIYRDATTGEVVYAECRCKPVNACPEGCECLTKEDAVEKFAKPMLCSPNPCGMEGEYYTYCFREGGDVCRYDREQQRCVGGCEMGECTLVKDSYGNPFCRCLTKAIQGIAATTVVERVVPDTAPAVSCIPVRLIVVPAPGVTGLIITETYPAEFEFRYSSIEPASMGNNTVKWLLIDEDGVGRQEILYKLCIPRGAAGDYYFRGIWETEGNAGVITGDDHVSVIMVRANWPPCPVDDQTLLNFVGKWSKGKLSDLEFLQVVEVWKKGCGG